MSRIIFLGTSEFAVPILEKIILGKHNVIAVITKPPQRSKRGQKIHKSPIHIYAEKKNLLVKTPSDLDDEKIFYENIDIAVVVSYGKLISQQILNTTKYGFINIHASLLPKYRGAAPIQRSIISLDKTTGISIMKIDNLLDHGPICNQYKIDILDNENSKSLSKRLSQLGANNINHNIHLILNNKAKFIDQNDKQATYAKKIEKIEGKINWNSNAENIQAKINGFYPVPGAWFSFRKERYKIYKATIKKLQGIPGKVIDDDLTIACGKDSLKVIEIQKEGKKIQNVENFLVGNKINKNSILDEY